MLMMAVGVRILMVVGVKKLMVMGVRISPYILIMSVYMYGFSVGRPGTEILAHREAEIQNNA